MDLDDRIGLLGVNGAGKSTFAKMIAGALDPADGEFHRDRKMRVGWFHQHQIEAMDPNDTPLEIIRRAMPDAGEPRAARGWPSSAWASRSRRPRSPTCRAASGPACC